MSEQERSQIVNRLTDGRIPRWLEEGGGGPAGRPFGFRRGGLRRVVERALEMGSNLKSLERIRKILRDPMYVTGECAPRAAHPTRLRERGVLGWSLGRWATGLEVCG